jgi:aspartyl-tRNA(Asn)/glutamyl-tRNA(Gln) amidotransferase subunit A
MNLTELSLAEAAQAIARRETTPEDLTRACLERIEQVDPKINSFITPTPETALQQAREAEEALQRKQPVSPLHGIPLALKDLYETKGIRTTAGTKHLAGYVPEEDAAVVEKLKAAGSILLGKLNMHEIALGLTNVNPHYGPCRNPWALDRVPGGSSGGSAAAVAAGLCFGSLGSDTGGSIRVPAGLCGIVGLKPTYGRISLRGVIPLSWNLDHAGPMARRVRDVALLLQEIAGYDPHDPYSVDVPVEDYLAQLEGGVAGWRVGLAKDEYFTKADPEILAAVDQAAQVFTSLGARVEEVEVPGARDAAVANSLIVPSDGAAYYHEQLKDSPDSFGLDILQRLRDGADRPSSEYILARHTQSRLRRQFDAFFEAFDLLITPTTRVPAPPIEGPDALEQARLLTRFTAPFNLTGLPAISLPCGFTRQGLPIGLQLVSRRWAEASLLQAAYAYEQATEWHRMRPEVG